jgi:sugar O-acyltransferase (sialic acid O-acetyltransferase NeuD family)
MGHESNNLIIVGAGETAEIAFEYFSHDSKYEIKGFSVEKDFLKCDTLFNLPVIPFEEIERYYPPGDFKVFVAISFVQLNRIRTRLYKAAKVKGYSLATYISSKAFVWHNAEIGENCFIFENNVIQHKVKVGNNVILWCGSCVDHQTVIRDNCFFSSHVVIPGFCDIGENCFMGANACLRDHIKIAKDNIIGAGAVVIRDTQEGKIYFGNPAKPHGNIDSFKGFNVKKNRII